MDGQERVLENLRSMSDRRTALLCMLAEVMTDQRLDYKQLHAWDDSRLTNAAKSMRYAASAASPPHARRAHRTSRALCETFHTNCLLFL